MSALGFLNVGNALTAAASKLTEQQKQSQSTTTTTTTKTNPYMTQQQQQQVVNGALASAQKYEQQANAAASNAQAVAVGTQKTIDQGRRDIKTSTNAALQQAAIQYRTAVAASQQNNSAVELFQKTYGSDEHKKQMQQLYEQQQANTAELIAAQSQQDQGGFFNWIGAQFKAELAAEESRLTDATINQLKANEMQATQQLAASFQANELVAQNANAEEMARATMFKQQADTMVESAKQNLGFDKEAYAAQMQVLGMNSEAVNASMKRLDTMIKTNDLSVSAIQAEQQRILKETAELNLTEAKAKWERSEEYRITTEQDWKDHLVRKGIPETEHRPFEAMVAEQEATKVMNPLLIDFMASRNSLGQFEEKAATSSFTAALAGEDSPVVRQTVNTVKTMNAAEFQAASEEFYKQHGIKDKGFMTQEQQAKFAELKKEYDLQNPDGSLNRKRLAQLDKDLKELNKAAEGDVQIAAQAGAVDLQGVSQSLKVQNLTAKLVGAGADPKVAELVASGEAEKILLDIRPKSDVRAELESNIGAFINNIPEADIMNNDLAFQKIDAASKYMAKAYQLHRTSGAVKERFPSWRTSVIKADTLTGKASINLEDAGSLQLLMREQLIKRRATITNFNMRANKFLTERY